MPHGVPTGKDLPAHANLGVGQPSRFTQKNRERIYGALAVGVRFRTAAGAAGIAPATLYDWLKKGRASINPQTGNPEGKDAEYGHFYVECNRIHDEFVEQCYEDIRKMGKGETVKTEKKVTKKDGTVEESVEYNRPEWAALMTLIERADDDYKPGAIESASPHAPQTTNQIHIVYVNNWRDGSEVQQYIADLEGKPEEYIDASFTPAPAALPAHPSSVDE